MNFSKNISYLLIALGGVVALYAQAGEDQNETLLIGGIVVLMIGIYRISKHIPSKNDNDDPKNNIQP